MTNFRHFVKKLDLAKEPFTPIKKCFNNFRNHIELDKLVKIMETVPENKRQ